MDEDTLRRQTWYFGLTELKLGNSEMWLCLEILLIPWDLVGRGLRCDSHSAPTSLLSPRGSRYGGRRGGGSQYLGHPAGLHASNKGALHCGFAQSSCLFLTIDINAVPFAVTHRHRTLSY